MEYYPFYWKKLILFNEEHRRPKKEQFQLRSLILLFAALSSITKIQTKTMKSQMKSVL